MKTKLVLVTLSLISLLPVLKAQEQTNTYSYKNSKHALGFNLGYSTGVGLSYRHSFNKFAVQVAGLPYASENHVGFNAGLTFMYNLVQTDKSKFFLYEGNGFYYDNSDYSNYEEESQTLITDSNRKERELINSLGIGYEFLVYDRLGLSFMGGYAFSSGNYSTNRLSFTGEFSALYHF